MVETKTIVLMLETVPVGEPIFEFDSWNPPLDAREVFPAGAPWPSTERTYKEGETVYIHYCVKNVGPTAGKWTITVKNVDTGETLATWWGNLEPGYRFKTSDPGANLGKMPAKDWRLSFKVTP